MNKTKIKKYERVLNNINKKLKGCEMDPYKQISQPEVEALNQYDDMMVVLLTVSKRVEDDILTEEEVLTSDPEKVNDLVSDVVAKIYTRIKELKKDTSYDYLTQ